MRTIQKQLTSVMLLSLVGLIFLDSFKADHASKVTLIIMHISVLSSAIQQCMESDNSHATAILIPLPIVAYYILLILRSLYSLENTEILMFRGVARIFQRGGHTVSK